MSGISWLTGERDGPPYAVGGGIGDTVTSIVGVAAILAALVSRERTGVGQHIDLSMVESLAYVDCLALPRVLMDNGPRPLFRNGQQNSFTFPMGPFRASGGYIALQAAGAGTDSPWGRLCRLMGREDLVQDERLIDDVHRLDHVAEVVGIIEGWLCSLDDRDIALALLASERIPSGPVLSQEEMVDHPFFAERGTFGDVDYPELGPVKMVQPPFKFSDSQAFVRGPAPEMGEHVRKIVGGHLKRQDEELERLFASNVLYESEGARRRNQA
jgi:crotonobetainyl-CoA:carnitine CoA-transferase CaiB-like acyl-CoA transferase